jgi:acyl-CoA synthetase (NDP forming)
MNIIRGGFSGSVYPVGRSAEPIAGHRVYPTLEAIGETVELVIVTVPQKGVAEVIAQAGEVGARCAVIISAGFAESGEAGAASERTILEIARRSGLRLIGPNCFGVINGDPAVKLAATFGELPLLGGTTAIATQSGACGIVMLQELAVKGRGIGRFVSLGNSVDLNAAELLFEWGEDPEIAAIALYLEGLRDGPRFLEAARTVARRKPIFAVKAGRTAVGARAAASHTAALTSPERGIAAIFEQGGVVRCDSISELIDAVTLAPRWRELMREGNTAIITNSGGPAILFGDRGEIEGLRFPPASAPLAAKLRGIAPVGAAVANPIDLTAAANPGQFTQAIELAAQEFDIVVVVLVDVGLHPFDEILRSVLELDVTLQKPLAIVVPGGGESVGTPSLPSRTPLFLDLERAAAALGAVLKSARFSHRSRFEIPPRTYSVEPLRTRITETPGDRWLLWDEVVELLSGAGVRCLRGRVVALEDVRVTAETIGFPVVLKGFAEGLVHKSDYGGVVLDIRDTTMLDRAIARFQRLEREAGIRVERVLVQPFIDSAREGFIGVRVDPNLGTLISCGWGGTEVEVRDDIAVGAVPIDSAQITRLVDSLRFRRILAPFRGRGAYDRGAFEETIARIGTLAHALPELIECDLNPVAILPKGQGTIVLDARMRVRVPADGV